MLDVPVGAFLATLMVLGLAWTDVLLWRGAAIKGTPMVEILHVSYGIFPLAAGLRRGMRRASTLTHAGMACVLPALWVPDMTGAMLGVTAGGFALSMACAVPIVLFNRPRFLVAPVFRGEPGVVQAWLWRRRRARVGEGVADQVP
ncbi:hypothetical protein [Streptomyces sp. NPDC049881]|uniref:hypothetical protein n=1 Tax=Streptomyces sp. NPDC049881 TaxID=3155778 RepID=UPI0034267B51